MTLQPGPLRGLQRAALPRVHHDRAGRGVRGDGRGAPAVDQGGAVQVDTLKVVMQAP